MSVPSANSRNVERMCTAVWGINHFYPLNKKSAGINSGKKISTRYYPVDIFMDLAGIEQTNTIKKTLIQVTIFLNFTRSKFAYF